jgi:hypothetical protein
MKVAGNILPIQRERSDTVLISGEVFQMLLRQATYIKLLEGEVKFYTAPLGEIDSWDRYERVTNIDRKKGTRISQGRPRK